MFILGLPRAGTHFIWSRLIMSQKYQLIYDADRVPALTVLAERNKRPLKFLYPSPSNPNYNFQYNSLSEAKKALTAQEHLALLQNKYKASDNNDLFQKIMDLQDPGKRSLFSINRFCYTCSMGHLPEVEWTITDALKSLELLWKWQLNYNPNTRFVFICREIEEWAISLHQLLGPDGVDLTRQRLSELPIVLEWCKDHSVPVYLMDKVLKSINDGQCDFGTSTNPIDDYTRIRLEKTALDYRLQFPGIKSSPKFFRWDRLAQYMLEKDHFHRTSLVRSLGSVLLKTHSLIPLLGKRIAKDLQCDCLNNAAIQNIKT